MVGFTCRLHGIAEIDDNIASAKKFVIDGLVEADILADDGWRQVSGFSDTFEIDKVNPRVEVEIETTHKI